MGGGEWEQKDLETGYYLEGSALPGGSFPNSVKFQAL